MVASAVRWLHLAASPTFVVMALLSGGFGGAMPNALCSAMPMSAWTGMGLMYLLMSVFHAGPWLKLLASNCGTEAVSGGFRVNRIPALFVTTLQRCLPIRRAAPDVAPVVQKDLE